MNKMRLGFALLAAPLAAFTSAAMLSPVYAAVDDAVPTVGGAPMYPTKNIVENAVNSRDHTTLVAAVQTAGLVATLQGPGPFTVFAPVNTAFERLPAGTVPSLLRPENRGTLTGQDDGVGEGAARNAEHTARTVVIKQGRRAGGHGEVPL